MFVRAFVFFGFYSLSFHRPYSAPLCTSYLLGVHDLFTSVTRNTQQRKDTIASRSSARNMNVLLCLIAIMLGISLQSVAGFTVTASTLIRTSTTVTSTQRYFFGQPKDDGSPGDYVCKVGCHWLRKASLYYDHFGYLWARGKKLTLQIAAFHFMLKIGLRLCFHQRSSSLGGPARQLQMSTMWCSQISIQESSQRISFRHQGGGQKEVVLKAVAVVK